MDRERIAFVQLLTELAGRPLNHYAIERLIEYADSLDTEHLNSVWRAQRSKPDKVAYRDYLAMTLRWWDRAKAQEAAMRTIRASELRRHAVEDDGTGTPWW